MVDLVNRAGDAFSSSHHVAALWSYCPPYDTHIRAGSEGMGRGKIKPEPTSLAYYLPLILVEM